MTKPSQTDVDALIEKRWAAVQRDLLKRAGDDVQKQIFVVEAYVKMLRGESSSKFTPGRLELRDQIDPRASLKKRLAEAEEIWRAELPLGLLEKAVELDRRWDKHRQQQRINASHPKTADAFSRLLERTASALEKRGKRLSQLKVIHNLGHYDNENVLLAFPDATGLYGQNPDPKHT